MPIVISNGISVGLFVERHAVGIDVCVAFVGVREIDPDKGVCLAFVTEFLFGDEVSRSGSIRHGGVELINISGNVIHDKVFVSATFESGVSHSASAAEKIDKRIRRRDMRE